MRNFLIFISFLFLIPTASNAKIKLKEVRTIVAAAESSQRIGFGMDRLKKALTSLGYEVKYKLIGKDQSLPKGEGQIIVGNGSGTLANIFPDHLKNKALQAGKEAFSIGYSANGNLYVVGADDSGVLYGCLALEEQLKAQKKIPSQISISDHPEMVLRGTCIGLQKPDYLPGRDVYEYPYTPETFPWFYDKSLWIRYLDMMVENRYNSLYLWNGHPFSSLVKLKDYPYAVEVNEETFKKNEEIFRFVTNEADKRGIWIIQMFYNIIIPKPFAEKHHLKTQDRNRPIIPLIADYTRKSIAAFVEKYPNVGLMVALGEAMEGVGQDDVNWFTKTIIPGVKDGLKGCWN